MDLVQVDVVRLQPAQAGLERGNDVVARRALVVGAGAHGAAALGRDDQRLAGERGGLEPLSDERFGRAARIFRRPTRIHMAVSMKFPPAAVKADSTANEDGSSDVHRNVIVPRQSSLTLRPVRPSLRYSIRRL